MSNHIPDPKDWRPWNPDIDEYEELEDEIMKDERSLAWMKEYMPEYDLSKMEDDGVPPCCSRCSNHPNNGGSGVCWCTLPYQTGSFSWSTFYLNYLNV